MLQSEIAEWSYYLGCVNGQEVYREVMRGIATRRRLVR